MTWHDLSPPCTLCSRALNSDPTAPPVAIQTKSQAPAPRTTRTLQRSEHQSLPQASSETHAASIQGGGALCRRDSLSIWFHLWISRLAQHGAPRVTPTSSCFMQPYVYLPTRTNERTPHTHSSPTSLTSTIARAPSTTRCVTAKYEVTKDGQFFDRVALGCVPLYQTDATIARTLASPDTPNHEKFITVNSCPTNDCNMCQAAVTQPAFW